MNYDTFIEYVYKYVSLKDVFKLGIAMYLKGDLIATDEELAMFVKRYGSMGIANIEKMQKHLDSIK